MPHPKYHWTRDKLDARDYIFNPKLSANSTVSAVDLRPNLSPIEDQGYLGSCTGQAIASLVEFLHKKAKKSIDVSRLFIYYQERVYEGTVRYDSGAYIRSGIKAVSSVGVPLESLWPYDARKFAHKPSPAAYNNAATRKVLTYHRCADFAAVKNALKLGYPVVVGFDVYESFESDNVAITGIMPFPNIRREQSLGGHAVTLVGYDDSTQRFIARNSWGTGWGDRGYFYMPYRVIQDTTMSDDFWIITSITNP